jgi:hypothetical protein
MRLYGKFRGTDVPIHGRGTRLPLFRQLPEANPVLLRKARPQAAATLPLKSRKNPK